MNDKTCRDVTISMQKASFAEAEALCARQGGKLAAPRDAMQNMHIESALQNWHWADNNAWLGVSAQKGAGWRLDERGLDEPMAFSHWANNQPDNDDEKCVEMWKNGQGEWNDDHCDQAKNYACEVVVPSPDMPFTCSVDGAKQCRYELHTQKANAHQAFQTCKSGGATLAEPRTTAQLQVLSKMLREHKCANCEVAHDSMWVAVEDKQHKGVFKYMGTGEALDKSFVPWASGQPTLMSEPWEDGYCVEMWGDGTWNDRDCNVDKAFACEVPA